MSSRDANYNRVDKSTMTTVDFPASTIQVAKILRFALRKVVLNSAGLSVRALFLSPDVSTPGPPTSDVRPRQPSGISFADFSPRTPYKKRVRDATCAWLCRKEACNDSQRESRNKNNPSGLNPLNSMDGAADSGGWEIRKGLNLKDTIQRSLFLLFNWKKDLIIYESS